MAEKRAPVIVQTKEKSPHQTTPPTLSYFQSQSYTWFLLTLLSRLVFFLLSSFQKSSTMLEKRDLRIKDYQRVLWAQHPGVPGTHSLTQICFPLATLSIHQSIPDSAVALKAKCLDSLSLSHQWPKGASDPCWTASGLSKIGLKHLNIRYLACLISQLGIEVPAAR